MSHHPLVNIAIQAARKAGNTLMRALNRPEEMAQAEQHAYNDIAYTLQKLYPAHLINPPKPSPAESFSWFIEPINGKVNFLHSLPHFCVSLAVQHNHQTEHAVIYDPIRQELFTASRGQGGRLDNYRLRVSHCTTVESALIRQSGSIGLDLAYVAAGRLDGFVEKTHALALPETAAGLLLITEAGGLISQPNANTLIAANPKLINLLG